MLRLRLPGGDGNQKFGEPGPERSRVSPGPEEEMVKQTIQIFARVKPTVRKQPQGVWVGAARLPAAAGLPGQGRGGMHRTWAKGRGWRRAQGV